MLHTSYSHVIKVFRSPRGLESSMLTVDTLSACLLCAPRSYDMFVTRRKIMAKLEGSLFEEICRKVSWVEMKRDWTYEITWFNFFCKDMVICLMGYVWYSLSVCNLWEISLRRYFQWLTTYNNNKKLSMYTYYTLCRSLSIKCSTLFNFYIWLIFLDVNF